MKIGERSLLIFNLSIYDRCYSAYRIYRPHFLNGSVKAYEVRAWPCSKYNKITFSYNRDYLKKMEVVYNWDRIPDPNYVYNKLEPRLEIFDHYSPTDTDELCLAGCSILVAVNPGGGRSFGSIFIRDIIIVPDYIIGPFGLVHFEGSDRILVHIHKHVFQFGDPNWKRYMAQCAKEYNKFDDTVKFVYNNPDVLIWENYINKYDSLIPVTEVKLDDMPYIKAS